MSIVLNRFSVVVCSALLAGLAAPGAPGGMAAMDEGEAPPPTTQAGDDPTSPANAGGAPGTNGAQGGQSGDLLAGPTVQDETKDGGGRPGADGRSRRPRVGPRQWLQIVGSLELEEAVQTDVDAIVAEFRDEMQQFTREHGAAQRDLRQRMAALRGADEEADPRDLIAMRKELERLEALSPKAQVSQERIWVLLTEAQQVTLQQRLDRAATAMGERAGRGGRGVTDRARPADPATDAMDAGPMMNEMAGGSADGPAGARRRQPTANDGSGSASDENPRQLQARPDRRGGANSSMLRRRVRFLLANRAASRAAADDASDNGQRQQRRRRPAGQEPRPGRGGADESSGDASE